MRITGAESDEIAEVGDTVVENVVRERSNCEDYPKFHW